MKISRALTLGRTYLTDWRWTPFFLQRRVRSRSRREAMADIVARMRPRPAAAPEAAPKTLVDDLLLEGQALLGSVLTEAQCEQTRAHLMGRPVHDDYRTHVAPWLPLGEGRHPHSHVGYHDHADVARAPNLLA